MITSLVTSTELRMSNRLFATNNGAAWRTTPTPLIAAAAVLERPLAVEDVADDGREHTGDDLGDDGFGFEDRQTQRVEDRHVQDHHRATDDGELDELMVTHYQRSQRRRHTGHEPIGE